MADRVDVAVVGCGVFGAEIALVARSLGLSVTVFEAKRDILLGASANNQNRLHLGFHYPRDLNTGRQSIRGFDAFKTKYAACIRESFPNAYFIAETGSLTTPEAYLEFCKLLGVRYEPISVDRLGWDVRRVSLGILCDEVVYDFSILRETIRERLQRARVDVLLGERADRIERTSSGYRIESATGGSLDARVVINASYADVNRLTAQLGHPVADRQYEYTVVPVIRFAAQLPRVGITIMDGPFMTVLPYGKTNDFLLYNVELTVVARELARQLDPRWLNQETAPFAAVDKADYFKRMIAMCEVYVPALAEAQLVGFLEAPRVVLAKKEASDERPSIITAHDEHRTYFTIFAGKIDHCIWVAQEVGEELKTQFDL